MIRPAGWTATAPTLAGWYWVLVPAAKDITRRWLVYFDETFVYSTVHLNEGRPFPVVDARRQHGVTHWLGPLFEPDVPA